MADARLADPAETPVRAVARYQRVSPRKARRVVDLVRGLPVDDATALLALDPHAVSETVGKVLASAVANAEHNAGLRDRSRLVVAEAFVDEGPTLKRFRPRAQGRAYRIRKRTSHITIGVAAVAAAPAQPARRAEATKSKRRAR